MHSISTFEERAIQHVGLKRKQLRKAAPKMPVQKRIQAFRLNEERQERIS
jgi:hypothetical protein